MKTISQLMLLLLLFASKGTFAQSNEDKNLAKSKAEQAFKLEDEEGKYDEAIQLLEEAQKLDPKNINYPYELAYSYSAKKEYQKATDILEKLLNRQDVFDQVYQSLGNNYDYLGKPELAMKTYEAGLKKFPNSGKIYTELGNMKYYNKQYNDAIKYYEKGIEMEPTYSANYYRVAKIFLDSDEKIWGMLYGELFMNLDRNSKRTQEMSKLLYNTYKSQITFKGDTASTSFSKNISLSIASLKDPTKFKLPFQMIYEANMIIAAKMTTAKEPKEITLQTLSEIRKNYLEAFIKAGNDKKYPNLLFDFHKTLLDKDYLEPYTYWILMEGDQSEFNKWQLANHSNWNNFAKWFGDNPLTFDATHKFLRTQYQ